MDGLGPVCAGAGHQVHGWGPCPPRELTSDGGDTFQLEGNKGARSSRQAHMVFFTKVNEEEFFQNPGRVKGKVSPCLFSGLGLEFFAATLLLEVSLTPPAPLADPELTC